MKTHHFYCLPFQILYGLLLLLVTVLAQAQSAQRYLGTLESPGFGTFVSGLGAIRGWVCEADESVEVVHSVEGPVEAKLQFDDI